ISDTASTTAIPTMDMGRRARTPAEEKANAPGRARTSRYGWSIRPLSQRRPTGGHRTSPRAAGSGERGGDQVLRGLLDGSVGFGGEESAGASFLRQDGTVWTTDKDGILLALLASEITARTGHSPSQ